MHKKFGKDRVWLQRYARGQTDTQTDMLITILRHRSRGRNKYF